MVVGKLKNSLILPTHRSQELNCVSAHRLWPTHNPAVSMRTAVSSLSPSTSLPPLRSLLELTEGQVVSTIRQLFDIFCPLPGPLDFSLSHPNKKPSHHPAILSPPQLDSGYVTSAEDDDEEVNSDQKTISAIRADSFELEYSERWLTGFIARIEELQCFGDDRLRQDTLDQSYEVLQFLHARNNLGKSAAEDESNFTRDFTFELSQGTEIIDTTRVEVQLNDGLAGTSPSDCTDVGLQSWGASIILCELICKQPDRFGLNQGTLGTSARIVELGAGTGLVSMVLGVILPRLGFEEPTVFATDHHPAVLENLRNNIAANFSAVGHVPVEACLLDWCAPTLEAPLNVAADLLLAADVIYAPQHAQWLHDCATRLLAPNGSFWLVATVRLNGRFEGVSETVEVAFSAHNRPAIGNGNGKQLSILHAERMDKRDGVGRGDESGYILFRIGWT